MIVDVHCHLNFPQFREDVDEVIDRAKNKGVVNIVNAGTDHKTNLEVLELAKKDEILKTTLGLYPTYAMNLSQEDLEKEIEFIRSKKDEIVGIGEIGLDFHLTKEGDLKQKQIVAFKKIISSLKDLNKVFVIHSRKAERECIEILEEFGVKKVNFHCFSGSFKLAKRIEDNGWTMSIPANIDKSEHFQGIVKQTSINNLLTETDAPFLSPLGESRSESSFISETIKRISEIKNMNVDEVEKNIYFNYQKLFF